MTLLVRREAVGGVATITLDSPANRNALSVRLLGDLEEALIWAIAEPSVRVIVLTATGPVFCSGADLKEQRLSQGQPRADLDEQSPAQHTELNERPATLKAGWAEPGVTRVVEPGVTGGAPVTAAFPGIMSLVWESPKPVICRLNGTARAGGLGLVAACDFAIAPETASFAFTEVRLGVVPAMISVTCLRRLDPRAAAEYLLTGEAFSASRAAEIGLITRAVPEDELDATVAHYADMLLRGGPEALAITKRLVREVPLMPVDEGFREMAALSAQRFTSAEGQEGIRAFMEKRAATWIPQDDAP